MRKLAPLTSGLYNAQHGVRQFALAPLPIPHSYSGAISFHWVSLKSVGYGLRPALSSSTLLLYHVYFIKASSKFMNSSGIFYHVCLYLGNRGALSCPLNVLITLSTSSVWYVAFVKRRNEHVLQIVQKTFAACSAGIHGVGDLTVQADRCQNSLTCRHIQRHNNYTIKHLASR